MSIASLSPRDRSVGAEPRVSQPDGFIYFLSLVTEFILKDLRFYKPPRGVYKNTYNTYTYTYFYIFLYSLHIL
jgi:hypothetical protein